MKVTDWRWNGRCRRHGEWFVRRRWLKFSTYNGSPRWFLTLPGLHVAWWPKGEHRLELNLGPESHRWHVR